MQRVLKRIALQLAAIVPLALISTTLIFCEQPFDEVTEGDTTSSFVHNEQWIGVSGTDATIHVFNPSRLPGPIRKSVSFAVQSHAVAIATNEVDIWISCVSSTASGGKGGGIYRVDLATGNAVMLVDSLPTSGAITSLFAVSPDSGGSTPNALVGCNRSGVYAIRGDGSVVKLIGAPPGGSRRWAIVGGEWIYALSQDGILWTSSLFAEDIKEASAGWVQVQVGVRDMARSNLDDQLVVASGLSWRSVNVDVETPFNLQPQEVVAPYESMLASSFAFTSGSELVVVQATDRPARTTWTSKSWSIESRGLTLFDATALD
jgi:hypothetical protein